MSPYARLLAPLAIAALAACSDAAMGTPTESSTKDRQKDGTAVDGNADTGQKGSNDNDDELSTLELIASGLESPSELVMHAGTAYVTTTAGLVQVSPAGNIAKLDGAPQRICTDGVSLVWSSSQGITSAPFTDLLARKPTPLERLATNLTGHGGRAFFTLVPGSSSGVRNAGPLLRSDIATGGSPQPVTANAAMNYTAIAADSSHVFYFAPPNENAVEVRRVRATGGDPERVGFVASGHGSAIVLTDTTVFFTVSGDGLYAVPKGGGVAARYIASGGSPVASASNVYFLSSADEVTSIHRVDANGGAPKLVAQTYNDNLVLAIDDSGLYALSTKAGALYKVTKRPL